MEQNVVERIKELEKDSKKRVDYAKNQGETQVRNAQKDSISMIEEFGAAEDAYLRGELEKEEKKLGKEVSEIIGIAEGDAEKLGKAAGKKKETVVDFLLKEFKRRVL
ncbi:MAG: hypothetical protein ABIG20_02635 [archaeon]